MRPLRRLIRAVTPLSAIALASACTSASPPAVEPTPAPAPAPPRNAVLVIIDTLRADHLETYGYTRRTSPRLYRWSQQAAIYDHAYSHAPWTKPSLATLLTSQLPAVHGVWDWTMVFTDEVQTLPQVLRRRGFTTEAYLSHHALIKSKNRFHRGFDVYDTSVIKGKNAHEVATAKPLTDLALDALERLSAADEPFFLLVHYFDTHNDYIAHPQHPFGSRPADRYDSELAYTDRHLGRLLDALEPHLDDTTVWITADHGEEFRDHGGKYHTSTLYEELVRVPLIIRGPEVTEPVRHAGAVRHIDFAPTLLDQLGEKVPEFFAGEPMARGPHGRIPDDPPRPVLMETRRFANLRGVVSGDHKLIHDLEADTWRLFDLDQDPRERTNLWDDADAELRGALESRVRAYEAVETAGAEQLEADPEFDALLEELGYMEPADKE